LRTDKTAVSWRKLRHATLSASIRICAGCAVKRTVGIRGIHGNFDSKEHVATKDHRRHAKGLIEALEFRVHVGPPIHDAEIVSAREFLVRNDFAVASDYFSRLAQIQNRLGARPRPAPAPPTKRNYGGEAGGYWMQLQSAFDHVILSTCHEGDFNSRHGRVKISHRFNRDGRIDFVELKFLRPLDPCLQGEYRKLLLVKDYATIRRDWRVADAFVLPVLPRELIFLYGDIFRCPKNEVLAWLVNIGHRIAASLLEELRSGRPELIPPQRRPNGDQLCLAALRDDEVALPILQKAAPLESAVDLVDPGTAEVRYANN
jgi:hypothetical protein